MWILCLYIDFVSGALELIKHYWIIFVCTYFYIFMFMSSHGKTQRSSDSVTLLWVPPTQHVTTKPKAHPSM